ncbi:eukaryotic translation initiation factor 3 subunit J [Trichogramma pretiosum]|uniref:Eukaryotic translation initiation factor 3 subunit J n=1 Tax=Trichogramma kaykai TaxID=54128 RepID=A0ABD2XKN5_9HYME|nr:eukaryotic translation initiation factor 3 subunit J [Trichogramma pretiosum]
MDDWETEKVEAQYALNVNSNKWEGEDEDDEVLDSWENIDEEKKDVEKPAEAPKVKAKPKRTLAEKIEEKERKAREEAERKAKERDEALTPEERRAEMLRRQKLQEEADLRLAMETFGVTDNVSGIDAMMPTNAEEFKEFGDALMNKINQFNKHADYTLFAEELIKNISISLPATSLRKVKTSVESLHTEKVKMEKEKQKGKSKSKSKAKLRLEGDSDRFNNFDTYDDNDYDDFM